MYTIKVHIAALTYYAEDYPELKGYVIEVSQTGTEIINGWVTVDFRVEMSAIKNYVA